MTVGGGRQFLRKLNTISLVGNKRLLGTEINGPKKIYCFNADFIFHYLSLCIGQK